MCQCTQYNLIQVGYFQGYFGQHKEQHSTSVAQPSDKTHSSHRVVFQQSSVAFAGSSLALSFCLLRMHVRALKKRRTISYIIIRFAVYMLHARPHKSQRATPFSLRKPPHT